MKIGDTVRYKDEEEVAGIIQDIGPCHKKGCYAISLTFDPPGGFRWYHHIKGFVVVESVKEKVSQ